MVVAISSWINTNASDFTKKRYLSSLPLWFRFSSTRVLPLLCFFIHTHARRKRKQKRRWYRRVLRVYIEVRQNAKRDSFFAFGLLKESANKDSAPREEEEKSHATELMEKNPYSSRTNRQCLSLFFSILNPKLEKTSFFVLNPNTLKNLFFFVKGKSTTPY